MIQRAQCAGIEIGSEYDCLNPLRSGVRERIIIGNLKDVESVTYDLVDTSIITDITMKVGTAAYAFEGTRSSVNAQYDFVAQELTVGFTHQATFAIFEVDAASKNNIQAMAAVKTFAIIENPSDSSLGDAVFEVLGINAGLEVTVATRIAGDQATGGAYSMTLQTPTTSNETGLPNSWFDTDIPTTAALVEAILVPAV